MRSSPICSTSARCTRRCAIAANFLYGYFAARGRCREQGGDPGDARLRRLAVYFPRAYFAWKVGLPVGFRDCDRGTDARSPRCSGLTTNEDAPPAHGGDVLANAFFRLMSNHVQSGSARTALDDEETDYYPVRPTARRCGRASCTPIPTATS